MKYQEFMQRGHFDFEEFMAFAYGTLVTDLPANFDAMRSVTSLVVIGDSLIYIDDKLIATVAQPRTGVFRDIAYRDYPLRSQKSVGGIMER